MKIVVCIKQVPDTKGGVKFNPDGTLDRGAMLAIMNPDDKAGLEAALKLKDEFGAEVTVLTWVFLRQQMLFVRHWLWALTMQSWLPTEYWAVLIPGLLPPPSQVH